MQEARACFRYILSVKLTFLGTSAGTPTRTRNVSALALHWTQSSEQWLFDCGEGTQHQILRAPSVRLSRLSRIFITHLHGDHIYGLPGLLATRSLIQSAISPVTLYGPPGLAAFVQCALEVGQTRLRFGLTVEEVAPGAVWEDETRTVTCETLEHGIESLGYRVSEKPKPGRFDAAEAARLGVPAGPLFGQLKNGETVTLADGTKVDGRTLTEPPRPGRTVTICGDTGATPNAVTLARNADALVHEATFLSEHAERARQTGHSTAAIAATAAREANVKTLILTHFSPRYESDGQSQMNALLAEAQAIFPQTLLAEDFWSYDIAHASA